MGASATERVEALADKWDDGVSSEDEREELTLLLKDSGDARLRFIEMVHLSASLRLACKVDSAVVELDLTRTANRLRRIRRRSSGRAMRLAIAVAAAVVLFLVGHAFLRSAPAPLTPRALDELGAELTERSLQADAHLAVGGGRFDESTDSSSIALSREEYPGVGVLPGSEASARERESAPIDRDLETALRSLESSLAATGAPAKEPGVRSGSGAAREFLSDADVFPLGVWMQKPVLARRYAEAGINMYVGLWLGPTAEQLAMLDAEGMRVVCEQNDMGLAYGEVGPVVGWSLGDSPDNAQRQRRRRGYGPPVLPEKVAARYRAAKVADPSRPVVLHFGQGVVWDNYYGRGVRTRHPEDYVEYVKSGDIVSFHFYVINSPDDEVTGKLWLVHHGVRRLVEWTDGAKPVWTFIETTSINDRARRPEPRHVRAEVWMSIVGGATGIVYFVHQFNPEVPAALLEDERMFAAITAINRRIASLAPVLNSPTVVDGASVNSSSPGVPIEVMTKRRDGETYVFAVAMRDAATTGTFAIPGIAGNSRAVVLDESREIEVVNGRFDDHFGPYGVHLYRIAPRGSRKDAGGETP